MFFDKDDSRSQILINILNQYDLQPCHTGDEGWSSSNEKYSGVMAYVDEIDYGHPSFLFMVIAIDTYIVCCTKEDYFAQLRLPLDDQIHSVKSHQALFWIDPENINESLKFVRKYLDGVVVPKYHLIKEHKTMLENIRPAYDPRHLDVDRDWSVLFNSSGDVEGYLPRYKSEIEREAFSHLEGRMENLQPKQRCEKMLSLMQAFGFIPYESSTT